MDKHKIISACTLLKIGTDSNLAVIKKAYWQKVKTVHPDVNTSPNAHHEFIQLTAAYDYLSAILTPGQTISEALANYNTQAYTYQPTQNTNQQAYYEALKQEALRQAAMRYNIFINSAEYKLEAATDIFLNHIKFWVLFIFFSTTFIWALSKKFTEVSIGVVLLIFMFVPFLYFAYTLQKQLNYKQFKQSFKILLADSTSSTVLLWVLSLVIFILGLVFIGTDTMISMADISIFFLVFFGFCFFCFWSFFKLKGKPITNFSLISKSILATVFAGNVLLALNFFINDNQNVYVEDSVFEPNDKIWQQANIKPIEYCIYDDLVGIKNLRYAYQEEAGNKIISFTYKKGILGYYVIKGYCIK